MRKRAERRLEHYKIKLTEEKMKDRECAAHPNTPWARKRSRADLLELSCLRQMFRSGPGEDGLQKISYGPCVGLSIYKYINTCIYNYKYITIYIYKYMNIYKYKYIYMNK